MLQSSKRKAAGADGQAEQAPAGPPKLIVESYTPPDPGPYPQDKPPENTVRFTPVQVGLAVNVKTRLSRALCLSFCPDVVFASSWYEYALLDSGSATLRPTAHPPLLVQLLLPVSSLCTWLCAIVAVSPTALCKQVLSGNQGLQRVALAWQRATGSVVCRRRPSIQAYGLEPTLLVNH